MCKSLNMEVLSYLQTRKIDHHHRFVVTNHRIVWFYAETRELKLLLNQNPHKKRRCAWEL